MKKYFSTTALLAFLFSTCTLTAQEDKSKRPSPPATTRQTIASGATIQIDYSQPGLKGRTIGKDVEPMRDKLWRAGANEATVFAIDKPVTIEDKPLATGKYALFMIDQGDNWIIIFNKTWEQGGTSKYKQDQDALRISVKPGTTSSTAERLTYAISKAGKVSLLWGDREVSFTVK